MENARINLHGVQETLLMPLWGRVWEMKKETPLLIDTEAVRIINSIDYDFSRIESKVNPLSRASWVSRSIYFDGKIKEYFKDNPEGTIIDLGCGLDTTYDRVNNGKAVWYELDLPEVIEIRKKLIRERENRRFLPFSITDPGWYARIENKDTVLIMMAGVIYYFEEAEIKKLFESFMREFKKGTIICDYSSKRGTAIANKKVIEDAGMDKSAYLKWGIDNIQEIEKWDERIKVIENMRMFKEHRDRYPFQKRLGMWISDTLSIMSLAKIEFCWK